MNPATINVVGSGLAGSIVTRLLRHNGFEVRLFDDRDPNSASQASSNLFIDAWLKKFMSAGAANGVSVLRTLLADHIDKPFASGIAAAMKVNHIAQRHVLLHADYPYKVIAVDEEGCWVTAGSAVHYEGPTVICTGYRGHELDRTIDPWVKVGHALFFEGELPEGKSRLAIVSPYTHEKLYMFAPGIVYYADSVAVKRDVYGNRELELKQRTLDRARRHVGNMRLIETKVGFRPFVTGYDFGYAERVRPNVYVVNSGGKNGMVAYANAACKILAMLTETK